MKPIKTGLFAALGVFALGLFAPAFAGDMADKAVGTWLRSSTGWHVEFSMCGDKLCGEVVAGDGVDKKTGESVIGIKMLYDLEKISDDKWKGKMYNPGDGGTYKGIVQVLSDDQVKMSGCMMGIMCRSEKWSRVEDVAPAASDGASDMMMEEDSMEGSMMEEHDMKDMDDHEMSDDHEMDGADMKKMDHPEEDGEDDSEE
jgi:uncharacterized protein (DUF2147 family)